MGMWCGSLQLRRGVAGLRAPSPASLVPRRDACRCFFCCRRACFGKPAGSLSCCNHLGGRRRGLRAIVGRWAATGGADGSEGTRTQRRLLRSGGGVTLHPRRGHLSAHRRRGGSTPLGALRRMPLVHLLGRVATRARTAHRRRGRRVVDPHRRGGSARKPSPPLSTILEELTSAETGPIFDVSC